MLAAERVALDVLEEQEEEGVVEVSSLFSLDLGAMLTWLCLGGGGGGGCGGGKFSPLFTLRKTTDTFLLRRWRVALFGISESLSRMLLLSRLLPNFACFGSV